MNKDFLETMIQTCSVSGHEETLQRKVIEYMKPLCDEILSDATGNVISVLNPDSDTKVLLCGHIDEIGFIVKGIESNGMIKVINAGGVRCGQYLGTHVSIYNSKGVVNGVVITNSSLLKNKDLSSDDLMIDIGAISKEEACKVVSIGDPICASVDFKYLLNNRVAARAFDNRIGAFIVLEALRKAKDKGCKIGVYSATTVGEETTMRGAHWASQKVKPTCAIAVDVTFTNDYAGAHSSGDVSLDEGPVLCYSSIVNKKLNEVFIKCAQDLNLNLQYEVCAGRTGTDADKVHFTNDGVPVALVSIPLRYMHSSIETLSLKDVEEIIDLLAEFLCQFDNTVELNPII